MKINPPGNLYLIPKTISDNAFEEVIPTGVLDITRKLKYFIVENERTARRYLSRIKSIHPINEIELFLLNKHTKYEEIEVFFKIIEAGFDVGLMSEAGIPAVADPGSIIVSIAHQRNFKVVPLVGPSSILLALMASGLNGQNFSFNGYLPINHSEKIRQIKFFEKKSVNENQTQIFIETPFRNDKLFSDLLMICDDTTLLCVAINLTAENEFIKTLPVKEWKKNRLPLNKQPAIFLLGK